VMADAARVLETALANSRKGAPRLYATTAWELLPV